MKKSKNVWLAILAMALVLGMTVVGCGDDPAGDKDEGITVNLTVGAIGSPTTTVLTLTFSQVIPDLSADDITLSGVSGVTKGTLTQTDTSQFVYTLSISGFTSGGTLNVAVTKSGYSISPKTVTIVYNGSSGNGNGKDALDGTTWNASYLESNYVWTFNSPNFALTANGSSLMNGTYTISGNSITLITVTGSDTATLSGNTISWQGQTFTKQEDGGGNKIEEITSSSGVAMVPISAGIFTMGSPTNEPNRYDNETQHSVTLTQGFYMGKYQVTQEQYQAVMGTNPSFFSGNGTTVAGGTSYNLEPAAGEVQEKRPVESVNWYDALVFCNKLSVMEGLTPAYSINGNTNPDNWGTVPTSDTAPNKATWDAVTIVADSTGYRLPTEAQWEYACRAGTTTAYNTGATISNDTGWYTTNSNSRTHEVSKKPPNAWGLYDMHGNVNEWCWDRYGDYASGVQTDPAGVVSGLYRVRRGGTWIDFGRDLRSACRYNYGPYLRNRTEGFRLVRP